MNTLWIYVMAFTGSVTGGYVIVWWLYGRIRADVSYEAQWQRAQDELHRLRQQQAEALYPLNEEELAAQRQRMRDMAPIRY
jgi:membrane protein YqaA with SNARE-associated domain